MHTCTRRLTPKMFTLVERSYGTVSCDTFVTLWDTLAGHSCGTLSRDTFFTLWDTLAGHSCGTLLWTLVQHSCGTDVVWPHKLTVLRPQLPETASRTTFVLQSCQFYSSQKLLAALHLYYQVASRFSQCSCRTLLSGTLSNILAGHCCGTDALAGQFQMTLLWDTLVGHSCGTLL